MTALCRARTGVSIVAWVIQESRSERDAGCDWQGAGSISTAGGAVAPLRIEIGAATQSRHILRPSQQGFMNNPGYLSRLSGSERGSSVILPKSDTFAGLFSVVPFLTSSAFPTTRKTIRSGCKYFRAASWTSSTVTA